MPKLWIAAIGVLMMLLAAASASESVEFWNLEYDRNSGEFGFKIENVGTEDIDLDETFLYLENDNGDTIDIRFPLDEILYEDDVLDVKYESWNPFFEDSCELEKKLRIELANSSEGEDIISTRFKYLYCEEEVLDIALDTYPKVLEEGNFLRLYGTVEKGGVRLKTARIDVLTSWGHSFTDYSTTSGTFVISLFPPDGQQQVRMDFSWQGYNATEYVEFEVGGVSIVADAYPRSVEKGDTTRIAGRVTQKGVGVGKAYVEVTVGNSTVFTTANNLGEFSREVGITKTGDVEIEILAHKDGAEGKKVIMLYVGGEEEEAITISAPSRVKPEDRFKVTGRYLVDGEEVSKTIRVKFLGEYHTVRVEDGDFSLYLDASSVLGCYKIEVDDISREICVQEHSGIKLTMKVAHNQPGDNSVTYTAKYEDGSYVEGKLFYGFGSKQGMIENFVGIAELPARFGEGRYYSFGRADDGSIQSEKVVREIVIGNPQESPSLVLKEAEETPLEEAVTEVKFSVSFPETVEVFEGEEREIVVGIANEGDVTLTAQVNLGGKAETIAVASGETKELAFGLVGEEGTLVLSVEVDGVLREEEIVVSVKGEEVKVLAPAPKENHVYFIPYEIDGFGEKLVFEKLTDANGTVVFEGNQTLELPAKAGASFTLDEGEYEFCVGIDEAEDCRLIIVRQDIGIDATVGFVLFLGVLALLLFF